MLLLKKTVALLVRFLMTWIRLVLMYFSMVAHKSCMPNPVEGLLEVYEDMVEVLLVLKIFLTENAWVEDLLCGVPTCSEACLFCSDDLLRLWLLSVQYYLQQASSAWAQL